MSETLGSLREVGDKIVYSTTLDAVSTAKSRLERQFDPDSIRTMKATASRDLTVSGPNLAAHAFRAGWSKSAASSSAPSSSVEATHHYPANYAPGSS